MPISADIYQNQVAFDPFGSATRGYQEGLRLKDLARQQKLGDIQLADAEKQQAFKQDLNGAMLAQQQGNANALGDLGKKYPLEYANFAKQKAMNDLAEQKAKIEQAQQVHGFMAQVAGSVKDQASHDKAIAALKGAAIPTADIPKDFNAQYWDDQRKQGMDLKTQLDEAHKNFDDQHKKTMEGFEQQKISNQKESNRIQKEGLTSHRQDQAAYQTAQMVEGARATPDVKQAYLDKYASEKMNGLIGDDPNNVSPTMVRLAASEMAKIATGGVPTMDELKHLTPNSIPGTLAETAQVFLNHPTPANQGAFVKQMQDYANHIGGHAKSIINDRVGRVVDLQSKAMGPDHYANFKSKYPDAFGGEQGQSGGFKMPSVNDIDAEIASREKKGAK